MNFKTVFFVGSCLLGFEQLLYREVNNYYVKIFILKNRKKIILKIFPSIVIPFKHANKNDEVSLKTPQCLDCEFCQGKHADAETEIFFMSEIEHNQFKKKFEHADKNGDGKLSRAGLLQCLKDEGASREIIDILVRNITF